MGNVTGGKLNKLIGQCLQSSVTTFKQISERSLRKLLTDIFHIVSLAVLSALLIE